MIGEACRFYGWRVDYVLSMPAVTFFAMLEAMRELDKYEKIELCDIQAISICDYRYYEHVRARYELEKEEHPSTTQTPYTQEPLKWEEATGAIFSMFASGAN